jgi:LPXTG-site transpeptidase (sortase) family protein
LLEKNKQINFKKKSLIIIFIVFVLFVVFYFTLKGPIKNNLALSIENNIVVSNRPVRIKIPSINVDAPIESVGLTMDGAVDVPKGPTNAAWFDEWPRPGEIGNAVIVGHSGWKNGVSAVFDNLYKLQKGDKIYVENDTGVITTFIVREIQKYNPNADASDVFISNDGKSHLNLITCTGFWNKIWKSHSERLVVFTDKE